MTISVSSKRWHYRFIMFMLDSYPRSDLCGYAQQFIKACFASAAMCVFVLIALFLISAPLHGWLFGTRSENVFLLTFFIYGVFGPLMLLAIRHNIKYSIAEYNPDYDSKLKKILLTELHILPRQLRYRSHRRTDNLRHLLWEYKQAIKEKMCPRIEFTYDDE